MSYILLVKEINLLYTLYVDPEYQISLLIT
jgi:hypothetical protein